MLTRQNLIDIFHRIDKKGYKAYKDIKGKYKFNNFILFIDYVQGDPFASPSRVRLRVNMDEAVIPKDLFSTEIRKVAIEDFFTREIYKCIKKICCRKTGSGKSGLISIMSCGQEVFKRTAVVINENYMEVRLSIGLPANGRKILGREAEDMFDNKLLFIVNNSMLFKSVNEYKARKHVELMEDQQYIRSQMTKQDLVAFVANGSILPRESGISDKPYKDKNVVPFKSPKEFEISLNLPNHGIITGMGIKKGITLIVGGGYHGKSTFLKALERGVYNHILGDGREYVITVDNAVKIRAEDGRFIENVDINMFINNLPNMQDTKHFSTQNASGSTSQAANIMEAIEAGSNLLLLDEDTCATNFMIRDARMQNLIKKQKEPIVPFIDTVRQLYEEKAISCILVIGGCGDYFDVADEVIMMDEYIPYKVTEKSKTIASKIKTMRTNESINTLNFEIDRVPFPKSFEIHSRKEKIKSNGTLSILYGFNQINLQAVEQLVDGSQTVGISYIIKYLKDKYADGKSTLAYIIEKVYCDIDEFGIDAISTIKNEHPGDYSIPRKQEVFAAINRLRTLNINRHE